MASRLNDKKQPAPSVAEFRTLLQQCSAEYLTSWVESDEIYE